MFVFLNRVDKILKKPLWNSPQFGEIFTENWDNLKTIEAGEGREGRRERKREGRRKVDR